jgi:hypothetical protein
MEEDDDEDEDSGIEVSKLHVESEHKEPAKRGRGTGRVEELEPLALGMCQAATKPMGGRSRPDQITPHWLDRGNEAIWGLHRDPSSQSAKLFDGRR